MTEGKGIRMEWRWDGAPQSLKHGSSEGGSGALPFHFLDPLPKQTLLPQLNIRLLVPRRSPAWEKRLVPLPLFSSPGATCFQPCPKCEGLGGPLPTMCPGAKECASIQLGPPLGWLFTP